MSKFSVGDVVRVKTFDEIASDYGHDGDVVFIPDGDYDYRLMDEEVGGLVARIASIDDEAGEFFLESDNTETQRVLASWRFDEYTVYKVTDTPDPVDMPDEMLATMNFLIMGGVNANVE